MKGFIKLEQKNRMNITDCLKKYSDDYYTQMFVSHTQMRFEESYNNAYAFLRNFSIEENDFERNCLPIMQQIFLLSLNDAFDIYSMDLCQVFQHNYNLKVHILSPILTSETFPMIQRICKAYREKYFYVVEKEYPDENNDTAFKLRFPTNISWMELINGGFISDILFNMPYNQYYVFGESSNWGIWCDFENPWTDYQVFGSKYDIAEVKKYNEYMSLTKEEYADLERCTEMPSTLKGSQGFF